MKEKIDITLHTLHVGFKRRVVTVDINGKDYARKFLEKLCKDDRRKWILLSNRIENVSNFTTYENNKIFNYLADGIFEFKRPNLRLYAFYDKLNEDDLLILCTNGGTKNTKKAQRMDINRAKSIKANYFSAKKNPHS